MKAARDCPVHGSTDAPITKVAGRMLLTARREPCVLFFSSSSAPLEKNAQIHDSYDLNSAKMSEEQAIMPDTIPRSTACRICGSVSLTSFKAREMMLGWREIFDYIECNDCKCVQISDYPADIARHYPSDYYAYAARPDVARPGLLTRLAISARRLLLELKTTRAMWLRRPVIRNWLSNEPLVKFYVERFPDPRTRMLDVGCGAGDLLRSLRYWGFQNAEGVDPYIPHNIVDQGRTLVWKRHLSQLSATYDCISFHHALEHMPDQVNVLTEARRLLKPGGIIVIRIPLAGTWAWRTYREDWVQLDAPRHFYVHSERSLRLLAKQAGLAVDTIQYDSVGLQIWGSELYKRDIPLFDERSPARGSYATFSVDQLLEYDRRAELLNKAGDGDQILAILRAT